MGMFDHILCEVKLPDTKEDIQNEEFQTKNFECLLDTYVITKDRKLKLLEKNRIKTIPYQGDIIFYTFTGNMKIKHLNGMNMSQDLLMENWNI